MSKPKNRNKGTPAVDNPLKPLPQSYLWGVAALAILVYLPLLGQEYINYDDDWMIYENPFVTQLSAANIRLLFSGFYFGQYAPVSMLITGFLYNAGGGNVLLLKAGSLLLHLANTLLVYILFRNLLKDRRSGWIAMGFFALHPVQAESVAWLSASYKVGIFALFTLLGLIAWVKQLDTGKITWYLLALLCMLLACFSKEQALIFPLFILSISLFRGVKILRIKELTKFIPFLAASCAFVVVSYLAVSSRAEVKPQDYNLAERLFFLTYSFVSYLRLLIFPVRLAPFYGYPDPGPAGYLLYPLLSLLLGILLWRVSRRDKKVLWAFSFLFISLLLTFAFQVVSIRDTLYADRYLYLGVPAFFVALALVAGRYRLRGTDRAVWALLLLAAVLSFSRSRVFKNSETIWTDAIAKKYHNPLAYNNRGHYYRQISQYEKALADYNAALEINPDYHLSLNNRGKVYFDQGKVDLALADFNRCLSLAPEFPGALANRGAALASKGRTGEALRDLDKALSLDPVNTAALSNRALAFYNRDEFAKSAADITAYLALEPGDADMYNLRALCYNQMEMKKEALADYNRAIELKPGQGVFWQNRSYFFNKTGDIPRAMDDIAKAKALGLNIDPAYLRHLESKMPGKAGTQPTGNDPPTEPGAARRENQ